MNVIGIDFSINYPGICISEDFKKFKFLSVINTPISKKYRSFLEDLQVEYDDVHFIFIDSKKRKNEFYHITERNKLINFTQLVDTLTYQIDRKMKSKDMIVGIEGISFGSSGNALVDISQATGMLRKSIYESLPIKTDGSNFFVFAPGELKNGIGCKGNAKKDEIFNTFLKDPQIEAVKKSDFYKILAKYQSEIFNGKVVKSPFMDMIDAYLSVLKLYQLK